MKTKLLRLSLTLVGILGFTLPAQATDVERRISFAPATGTTTLKGRVDTRNHSPGEVRDRYMFRARKGQTVRLNIRATKQALVVVWHGDYNRGYLLDLQGASLRASLVLPANDDYVVDVENSDSPVLDYTLDVGLD